VTTSDDNLTNVGIYITRLVANITERSLLLDNESRWDENFAFVHGKSMILAILSCLENFYVYIMFSRLFFMVSFHLEATIAFKLWMFSLKLWNWRPITSCLLTCVVAYNIGKRRGNHSRRMSLLFVIWSTENMFYLSSWGCKMILHVKEVVKKLKHLYSK
jgi:hypothetical protein